MKYELSIIGLGYVGLPLALQFAKSGCRVLGLDIDPGKVEEIEAGRSYIRHIPAEAVAAQVEAGRFSASSDFSLVKQSEAVLICVPTPLKKKPRAGYLLYSEKRGGDCLIFKSRGGRTEKTGSFRIDNLPGNNR